MESFRTILEKRNLVNGVSFLLFTSVQVTFSDYLVEIGLKERNDVKIYLTVMQFQSESLFNMVVLENECNCSMGREK